MGRKMFMLYYILKFIQDKIIKDQVQIYIWKKKKKGERLCMKQIEKRETMHVWKKSDR